MSEDIDVKVKEEELEVVVLEAGRCANTNLIDFVPPPVKCIEIEWEPGKDGQPTTEALRKRRARQYETPEKKRARLDRENKRRKLKTQKETPEQRHQRLEHQRSKKTFEPKWKHVTDEELAEECKKILMEKRDKWGHKVKWDEAPDGKLLMTRKELESVKTAYQNFIRKKRKEKQMSAEERAQIKEAERFQKLVRTAHMTEEERNQKRLEAYLRRHAYEANMPEEKREKQRQRQRASCRRYYHNMTEEQRERYMVAQQRAIKKYHEKNKEKFRQYLKERWANQTPEQRQKTLQYQKISQARRQLKRKLEEVGTSQQEIQKQVDQLVNKMQSRPLPPLEQVSIYKPRPRKRLGSDTEIRSVQIHNQYGHHDVSTGTLQMTSSLGSSLTLSQSDPIFQEPMSSKTLGVDETDDYSDQGDDVGTPAPSLPPPSPSFDNEENRSACKLTQSPVLPSSAPSIPATCTSLPHEKKCPHCPTSFPELNQMQSHVRSMHPKKCWKCPKCSSVVLSSEDLVEHFNFHHARAEQEDVDAKIGSKEDTPETGAQRASSESILPFICMKCPVLSCKCQFETADMLLDHVRISHPKAFWPCPQCKLLKYNHASLKIHSKICRYARN